MIYLKDVLCHTQDLTVTHRDFIKTYFGGGNE